MDGTGFGRSQREYCLIPEYLVGMLWCGLGQGKSGDVSMWLHQVMKGYHDSTGHALPNAHLIGLFHRVCKLLYYRIRPVFVFDGGVPQLKQQTLASRRQQRGMATKKAEKERIKLLRNLMKHGAVRQALAGNKRAPSLDQNTLSKPSAYSDFILDPLPEPEFLEDDEEMSEAEDEDSLEGPLAQVDWDNFNPDSSQFKALSAHERIEILTELKETRKQNSWGRIHEMPKESNDFSGFQLKRLLVRHSAQVGLEEAEKELGERHSLTITQLKDIMEERGSLAQVLGEMGDTTGHRIASDTTTRFLLVQSKTAEQRKDEEEPKNRAEESENQVATLENGREISNVEDDDLSKELQIIADQQNLQKSEPKSLTINATESFDKDLECLDDLDLMTRLRRKRSGKGKCKAPARRRRCPEIMTVDLTEDYSPSDEEEYLLFCLQQSEEESELSQSEILALIQNKSAKKDSCQASTSGHEAGPSKLNYHQPSTSAYDQPGPSHAFHHHETIKTELKRTISHSEGSESPSKLLKSEPQVPLSLSLVLDEKPSIATKIVETMNQHSKMTENNLKTECINPLSPEKCKVAENKPECENNIYKNIPQYSSDTSSDGFEEVQDTSENSGIATCENQLPVVEVEAKRLEIVINSKSKLEDDMFADVFDTAAPIVESKHLKPNGLETAETIMAKHREYMAQISSSEDSEPEEILQSSVLEDQPSPPKLTDNELREMQAELETEQRQLTNEVGRQERMATSISDQMCVEAQQLLQMFGLPFVVAPMEAEAQCATLDLLRLTQGTVTDDSDVWLFGGRTVYKNFFNQKKNVEMFTAEAISQCFKLSRSQLVLLAMLVGSDYTSGLAGVGPVTALEILAAFPPPPHVINPANSQIPKEVIEPLKKFRDWWSSKKEVPTSRLKKLRTKLRDIDIHEGFPSEAVVEAYIHPEVDDSKETFTWGKPDIPALVAFAREKFGWSHQRVDTILQPVMRRLTDVSTQQKLDSYFSVLPNIPRSETQLSSRVREAISVLGTDEVSDDDKISVPQTTVSGRLDESEDSAAFDGVATPIESVKFGGIARPGNVTTAVPKQKRANVNKNSTLSIMKSALAKRPRAPKPTEATITTPTSSRSISTSRRLPSVTHLSLTTTQAKPTPPESIPQREKDKENALRSRLKAIEVFRKKKMDPTMRDKKPKRLERDASYLSESSGED